MSRDIAAALQGLHALRPADAAARSAILGHFGLVANTRSETPTQAETAVRRPYVKAERRARPSREEPYRAEPVPTDVERIDDGPGTAPPWLADRETALPRARISEAPTPPLPIIAPIRLRAILTELFAIEVEGKALDVRRLVDRVARGRLVAQLPRLNRRGMARRMLLLLDVGLAMDPFSQDQIQFAASVQRLFDPSRVAVRSFTGSPANGVRHPETFAVEPLETYRDAAIIILSDWGAADVPFDADKASPFDREEAEAVIARALRSAILNPYSAARRPDGKSRRLTVIPWREDLTLGQVRRAFAAIRRP